MIRRALQVILPRMKNGMKQKKTGKWLLRAISALAKSPSSLPRIRNLKNWGSTFQL